MTAPTSYVTDPSSVRSTESIPVSSWLDDRAVAELTGISVHTLRAHRQKRVGIAYAKIGRSVRYALVDVEAFMNAHRIVV